MKTWQTIASNAPQMPELSVALALCRKYCCHDTAKVADKT